MHERMTPRGARTGTLLSREKAGTRTRYGAEEDIGLSEINQVQTDKHCMSPLAGGI